MIDHQRAGGGPDKGASADAETGSREPSPKGLGPSGFDPARMRILAWVTFILAAIAGGLSSWGWPWSLAIVFTQGFTSAILFALTYPGEK